MTFQLNYGGTLSFDQKQNGTPVTQTNYEDVMLVKGDGTRIIYNTASNPTSGLFWSNYAIPLSEAGWKYTNLAGAPVSFVDFMDFISTFAVIKIRGDYSTATTETTWMDNVFITGPPILPIELNSFVGQLQNNSTAVLNWETKTEQNVSHFNVQKSIDLGKSFQVIGNVIAAGNSTSENFYSFVDEQCTSETYYRLQIVDFDNSISFSPIIIVKGSMVNTGDIELYPNPANSALVISNNIKDFTYDRIVISDIYGRVVSNIMDNNNSTLNLDIRNLAEGMYFVTLSNAVTSYTASFRIIR